MTAEIDVQRAVRLQRHAEVADAQCHPLAALIGDAQERRAGGDADHLDGESGHDHLADARDERHAPNDLLRVRADEAAARRGAADLGAALQVPVEPAQRQLALGRDAHRRRLRREGIAPIAIFEPRDGQHHLLAADRFGERGIPAGGRAVGLDEKQIDPDGCGPRGVDGGDELRDHGARPGPLAAGVERTLVDRHDHRRRRTAAARH